MKKLSLYLSFFLTLASTANAATCENALRGPTRKLDAASKRCSDNEGISKLQARLAAAKQDAQKIRIQGLIDRAKTRQQGFCTQKNTIQAGLTRIQEFCKNSASVDKSYCSRGYSIRIKGYDASAQCKRGRMYSEGGTVKAGCYLVEEYYFTSELAFRGSKNNSRGVILYSGQPSANFFQTNIGYFVDGLNKEQCSIK